MDKEKVILLKISSALPVADTYIYIYTILYILHIYYIYISKDDCHGEDLDRSDDAIKKTGNDLAASQRIN